MLRPPLHSVRNRRGWALATLLAPLLVLATASACGKEGDLPDGASLLSASSAVMKQVASAHSVLDIDGAIPNLPLSRAEGDISRTGDAEGSIQLTQPQLIQVEFKILAGQKGYLKYPTGGWQEATLVIMAVYNPAVLLDDKSGVSGLLATATNAKTVKSERVGGADTYRITANLDRKAAEAVVPAKLPDGLTGEFWIDKQSKQMLKTVVVYPATGGNPAVPVTLTLTNFGVAVNVSAP